MAFFNVFFRTIGFLLAITIFILLINILFYFYPNNDGVFKHVDGNVNSENIISEIELNGPIVSNISENILGSVIQFIDPEKVNKYLKELKSIKPKILLININSPGGTVSDSAYLEKIINNYKKNNNVKVYFYSSQILASGGYWAATSADRIFANYGSIIGSIGVSGPSWFYYDNPVSISDGILGKKMETKNGIKIFDQTAGKSKDLYNPFREPTKVELDHLQKLVEEIYDDFILQVSKSRNIEADIIKNDIGALIYTSKQAKKNFLIDDIIDYDDLIKKIVQENNLQNFKHIKSNDKKDFVTKYLINFDERKYEFICNQLNLNFVSILPRFSKNC